MFAVRVRAELERQCREALARTELAHRPRHPAEADGGKTCPGEAESGRGENVDPMVIELDPSQTRLPQPATRVRVGFARSRAGP
jgi:hypothetical protein